MVKVLRNPFHYGVFRLKGEIFEGSHPPIISKRLFDKVQDVFEMRSKPTRKARYNFAFRGYMRCGECGVMVTAEKKKGKYIYYHCTKRKTKCSQEYIEEKELAGQIIGSLAPIWINDNTKNRILQDFDEHKTQEETTVEASISKVQTELSEVSAKTDKLLDAYLSEIITETEFQSKKKNLVERKAALKQELEDLRSGHSEWFELAKNVIETCNSVEKIIKEKNFDDLSEIFQKTGSNFVLRDKKIFFYFQEPFDFIFSNNSSDDNSLRKDLPPLLVPKAHAKNFSEKRKKPC